MQAIFETLFDLVYLTTVITLGILMLRKSKGEKQFLLYGIMAVTLGCGDAFHLVPRAIALCTTGLADYTAALGIGKLVTSITMTAFYVLLYYVWRARYKVSGKGGVTAAVWVLSLSRILLCLMERKGQVVSRELLMQRLWETDSFVDENTLTVNVNRLRKKLEAAGLSEFIRTRFGVGYLVE